MTDASDVLEQLQPPLVQPCIHERVGPCLHG